MKYVSFGINENHIKCSFVAMGTHKFGGDGRDDTDYKFKDELCNDLLDCYIKNGGNFLDTANVYGKISSGDTSWSEVFLGEWMKSHKNRKEIYISTKGGHPQRPDFSKSRVNAYEIEKDINSSLKNLQTDYIDVYSLHRDNVNVPVSEIMNILNKYVKSGNIRVIGASNWTCDRINEANKYAKENGLKGFEFAQVCYGLAKITPQLMGDSSIVCMNNNEYNAYIKNGLTVMAYNSQAWGFFYENYSKPDNEIKGIYATKDNIKRLHNLRELCKKKNVTPQSVVLAYLTCNKLKVIPLISGDCVKHLQDSLDSLDSSLSPEEIDFLDLL